MSKDSANKIKILGFDELLCQSNEQDERYIEVALSKLQSFKNHPYKVLKDEKMYELTESIKENGLLVPGIVRKRNEGGYEIIAGHRRAMACEMAGLKSMKVVIMDLNDDEATVIMVDSNIQRERLLYSERAFDYKLRSDAMKHQGSKGDKLTIDIIGEKSNESGKQVQRYIRLTNLITELLDMVDDKRIAFIPAVDISYLGKKEQEWLLDFISTTQQYPTGKQAALIKENFQNGCLTEGIIKTIMLKKKPEGVKVGISSDIIEKYFPKDYGTQNIINTIIRLLEDNLKNGGTI